MVSPDTLHTNDVVILSRKKMTFRERVYLFEIVRGLLTTARHLVKHVLRLEAFPTYAYPEQPKPIPDGYRGEHRLMKRETGEIRCTACMLCATACPAECIDIIAEEVPNPDIEKRPKQFNINLLRCVFCGLCEEACPVDAIRMDTKKIDAAGYTRKEFLLDIGYLSNNHPSGMSPYSIAKNNPA